jgi:vesicle-fusing ATPase
MVDLGIIAKEAKNYTGA